MNCELVIVSKKKKVHSPKIKQYKSFIPCGMQVQQHALQWYNTFLMKDSNTLWTSYKVHNNNTKYFKNKI